MQSALALHRFFLYVQTLLNRIAKPMKKIFFLLLTLLLFQLSLFAQCGSGACPPGAINTLPAGGIIATGTTYCISGTISNTTAYTVNGTLIIQSGSVTVGDLTVGKTGSIIVHGGGRLMANSYTGDATAPASAVSNVTVCTNGYLYFSGAINPGETNFTVNDYGMFVIHGSWSTIISDTWFKLGMGSIVEMCSSFVFQSSTGFFTETSGGPSYVVTRSAMANYAGSGYLSNLGAGSQIKWDIPGGPVAWVTHPAANTCTGASCGPMLPPGSVDNGLCGSVAESYLIILLPLGPLDVQEQLPPSGDGWSPSPGEVHVFPDPATNFVDVSTAPNEKITSAVVINCMGQVLRSIPFSAGNRVVRCELPASLPAGIYFIRLMARNRTPLTVRVMKTP
jgi:hypothetical protein